MTYEEIIPIAKKGKLIKLPYWNGYFKWNYKVDKLEFLSSSSNEQREVNNFKEISTDDIPF